MRTFARRDVEALPVDREPIGGLIYREGISIPLESGRPADNRFPCWIGPNVGGGKQNKTNCTEEHKEAGTQVGS